LRSRGGGVWLCIEELSSYAIIICLLGFWAIQVDPLLICILVSTSPFFAHFIISIHYFPLHSLFSFGVECDSIKLEPK
jgi:hypothetical protein